MYRAAVNGVKHGLGRKAVFAGGLVFAFCCLCGSADALAQCAPIDGLAPRSGDTSRIAVACRFDAVLTRTFTPHAVPENTYRVYVADAPLDKVLAAFAGMAGVEKKAGAWIPQEMDPLDAFGDPGTYDRTKVARLYLGNRPRVVRGPIVQGGRTVASITLISPRPDATLTRLEPGTLIVDFRIPAAPWGQAPFLMPISFPRSWK